MANLCFNEIAFFTDSDNKSELKKLHEVFTRMLEPCGSIGVEIENRSLLKVADAHGINAEGICCRGTLLSINEINVENSSFILRTETAWSPTPELWNEVCKRYKGINCFYCAEEGGNGIYINTDREGKFLDKRYVIVSDCGDTDKPLPREFFLEGVEASEVFGDATYFPCFEELLSFMEENTGKPFETTEQISEYLEAAALAYNGGKPALIGVHEFSFE